jgi:hypothetical protein
MHPFSPNARVLRTSSRRHPLVCSRLVRGQEAGLRAALLVTVPPTLAAAFVCLAAWYPVRAIPLRRARRTAPRDTRLRGGRLSAVWVMVFGTWALFSSPAEHRSRRTLFVTGALLSPSPSRSLPLAGLERSSVRMLARIPEQSDESASIRLPLQQSEFDQLVVRLESVSAAR